MRLSAAAVLGSSRPQHPERFALLSHRTLFSCLLWGEVLDNQICCAEGKS